MFSIYNCGLLMTETGVVDLFGIVGETGFASVAYCADGPEDCFVVDGFEGELFPMELHTQTRTENGLIMTSPNYRYLLETLIEGIQWREAKGLILVRDGLFVVTDTWDFSGFIKYSNSEASRSVEGLSVSGLEEGPDFEVLLSTLGF